MLQLKRSFKEIRKNNERSVSNPDLYVHDDYKITWYDRVRKEIRLYKPSPSAQKILASDKFLIGEMGPFGGGKTVTFLWKCIIHSTLLPKWRDGVRRGVYFGIRNTYNELKQGIVRTHENWLDGLGVVVPRCNPLERKHTFYDGKGRIELTFFFLACDTEDDVKKFRSIDATAVYINEACKLPRLVMQEACGRVKRYPPKEAIDGEVTGFVGLDTNPPDTDNWIYQLFEVERPDNAVFYIQPPGLLQIGIDPKTGRKLWKTNPEAENIENLPENYYLDQAKIAKDDEYIEVHCNGRWGKTRKGKVVFPQYNDDLHSISSIPYRRDKNTTRLYMGWDFGYITPACVIAQYHEGFLEIIKEFVGDFISVEEMVKSSIIPWINANFDGFELISTCDPSDRHDAGTGVSCADILYRYKLPTTKAPTNSILPRLNAVTDMMSRLICGKPALLISREGAPVLRKSILSEYIFEQVNIVNSDLLKDIPIKTHPWSDVADALQYLCLRVTRDMRIPTIPERQDYYTPMGRCL